jgi:hypothetical protein
VKASTFYRIATVLILLFAVGHTLGFLQTDPTWKADSVVASMRSLRFDVQGFSRTYWDFFLGAGFTLSIFLLFAAVLSWQLSGLPGEVLSRMRVIAWAFVICFAGIAVLSWRYLFTIPFVFSVVIALCLLVAAWLSAKSSTKAT